MLPYKIEQGKALLAWKCFTEKENEKQPVVERKRVLKKTGQEQTFFTCNKAFKQTVTATGERLIKLYIRAYERSMAGGFRPEFDGDMPVLFINAVSLARQCNASDRTMRNHIRKLKKVGLISRYVFHGRNHDFELCITPKIMFPTDPRQVTDLQPEARVSPPECTDFPANVAFATTGNIEREISSVDKLGVAEPQAAMPAGDGTGNTLETSSAGHTGPQQGQLSAQSGPTEPLNARKLGTGAGGGAAPEKPPVRPEFLSFVELFWSYAKHVLYPHLEFDQTQDKLAKNAIWAGVYLGFKADLTEDQWEKYHLQAMERLDLAAQYYLNHPDKYPPMPYAEWVPDTGYFDAQNRLGFQKTLDWHTQKQVWAHQQRVSDALRRAKADFIKHKKGKAPKRLQAKSPLQLFKFHEDKIRRLGTDALNRFYRQHTIPNL
ncbi:helix-turn-helix transcriptional regulator [Rufibacter roseus]|uniref:Helix-turn-helix transcriptional regulator n=1 Tax=Rufibacter roseus TaxID=1567108 RepID=A0ABW2DR64_9BACT|nr:helix-turn-helix transcriptional regulator [Rufibacter roseus]